MPDGGTIDLILEDTLSDVIITVKDTGTGIMEDDKVKVSSNRSLLQRESESEPDLVWQQPMEL